LESVKEAADINISEEEKDSHHRLPHGSGTSRPATIEIEKSLKVIKRMIDCKSEHFSPVTSKKSKIQDEKSHLQGRS